MRNTLALIEEFLRPAEAVPARENAITALGALADDRRSEHALRAAESMQRLARLALADPVRAVRDHAGAVLLEVAASNPAAGTAAESALRTAVTSDERRRAYPLLARLRDLGLGKGPGGLLQSLRRLPLVAPIRSLPDTERPIRFQWRPALPAALGGAVGALLLALAAFIRLAGIDADALASMVVFPPLIAALLGLLAVQRSIPITLHYDRLAGGLVQLGIAVAWASPVAALLGLLAWISLLDSEFNGWLAWAVPTLGVLTVVAATRLGSMLPYGLATRKRLAFLLSTGSGAAFGLTATTALAWIVTRAPWLDSDWSLTVNTSWALLMPAVVGLAAAYGDVEQRTLALRRQVVWWRALAVALPLAAWVGLYAGLVAKPIAAFVALQGSEARDQLIQLEVDAAKLEPVSLDRSRDYELGVDFPQALLAREELPLYPAGEVALESRIVSRQGPGPFRLWWLPTGHYRLRFLTKPVKGDETPPGLGDLLPALRKMGSSTEEPKTEPPCRVVLNAFGGPAKEGLGTTPLTASGAPIAVVVRLDGYPRSVPFEVTGPRPQGIYTSLPDTATARGIPDLKLTLRREGRAPEDVEDILYGDDPPEIEDALAPGQYSLDANVYGNDSRTSGTLEQPVDLILLLSFDPARWQAGGEAQ